MKCPFCGFAESKVIDSRPAEEGATIRRRRECLACQKRFTTYEIIETLPLVVIKRDGSRQSFDKSKLINGMVRACDKRKVPLPVLEKIADEIEQELQSALEREITTEQVGEMVMKRLKDVDEVAYVRFASVYRQFKDIDTFMQELTKLRRRGSGCADAAGQCPPRRTVRRSRAHARPDRILLSRRLCSHAAAYSGHSSRLRASVRPPCAALRRRCPYHGRHSMLPPAQRRHPAACRAGSDTGCCRRSRRQA